MESTPNRGTKHSEVLLQAYLGQVLSVGWARIRPPRTSGKWDLARSYSLFHPQNPSWTCSLLVVKNVAERCKVNRYFVIRYEI